MPKRTKETEEEIVTATENEAVETEENVDLADIEEVAAETEELASVEQSIDIGGAEILTELNAPAPVNPSARRLRKRESPEDREKRIQSIMIARGQISDAIHNRSYMRGPVCGVEVLKSKEGDKAACLSVKMNNGIKVVIPYNEVFQYDPIDERSVNTHTPEGKEDLFRRQTQVLRKLIGLDVLFIPKALFEDNEEGITSVLASRSDALRQQRHTYYIAADNSRPHIRENNLYDATVMSVGAAQIMVELHGMEMRIFKEYLTNKYVENLEDVYHVGDKIPVLVSEIRTETGEDGQDHIRAKFNAIIGEIEEYRPNLRFLKNKEGTICFAKISKVRRRGEDSDGFRFYGWIENYDLPLKITNIPISKTGRPIQIGDRVQVVVRNVDVGHDGYVRGYVTAIYSDPVNNGK